MTCKKNKKQQTLVLVVFVLVYVIAPFIFFFDYLLDVTDPYQDISPDPWTSTIAILFYITSATLLLFFVVFNVDRYSYTEEGVYVRTLRGRRFFAFDDVQKAKLISRRGNVELGLNYGQLHYIYIPLLSYKKSRKLLMEIGNRLSVEIDGLDRVWDMVQDH